MTFPSPVVARLSECDLPIAQCIKAWGPQFASIHGRHFDIWDDPISGKVVSIGRRISPDRSHD